MYALGIWVSEQLIDCRSMVGRRAGIPFGLAGSATALSATPSSCTDVVLLIDTRGSGSETLGSPIQKGRQALFSLTPNAGAVNQSQGQKISRGAHAVREPQWTTQPWRR